MMKKWILMAVITLSLPAYTIELTQLTEYQVRCPQHPLITVDVDNYGLVTEQYNDHFEISAQKSTQLINNHQLLTVHFRNTDQFVVDQDHHFYYRFSDEQAQVSCQLINQHSIKLKTLSLYQAKLAETSIRQQR